MTTLSLFLKTRTTKEKLLGTFQYVYVSNRQNQEEDDEDEEEDVSAPFLLFLFLLFLLCHHLCGREKKVLAELADSRIPTLYPSNTSSTNTTVESQ